MSKDRPFLGMLQIHDDQAGKLWSLHGEQGSGTRLIVYQTGRLYSAYKAAVQLRVDGKTPTSPQDMYYLYDVPQSGNVISPNAVVRLPEAVEFIYGEGNTPALAGNTLPGGLPFGFWKYNNGASKIWGWVNMSTSPPTVPYTMIVLTPGVPHIRGYLKGICPDHADFTACDLSGEDWRGITATNALFDNSNLAGTDFTGANLAGADFRKALSLAGTIFDFTQVATLRGARFNATLYQTDLSAMDLGDVDFTGSHLTGTKLRDNDLWVAKFGSPPGWSTDPQNLTDLSGSTIDYEQMGLHWSFTNLTLTDIRQVPKDLTGLKAVCTTMPGRSFAGCNLADADLNHADLRACVFSEANLTSAILSGAWLQGDDDYRAALLDGAIMVDTDLSSANLTNTNLSSVYFYNTNATVAKATLVGTVFTNAYLLGLNFSDVKDGLCTGVNFDEACLVNVDFTGTNMSAHGGKPCTFYKACLQGADFTQANLDGADLIDAAVAQTAGSINVTYLGGWPPTPRSHDISYQPTLGVPAATTPNTICPSQEKGPCAGSKLDSPEAPTSWPVTT